MLSNRRDYNLSNEQPILRLSRKRRKRAADSERMEITFWKNFELEKLARDWQRALHAPAAAG